MFRLGDRVKLNRVTADDVLLRRYVGETGVFQGYDERGCAVVRFNNFAGYLVDESALSFVGSATVQSIFYAHCQENEHELIEALTELFESVKKK